MADRAEEAVARERRALERAYLAAPDAYGQSGFHGDAKRWESLRRPVVAAVDRDGAFLDIGCANGLLLESAVRWAGEDGHRLEPYGLDISPALADLARERLRLEPDRVFVGDAATFAAPRRFDFVRTELVYVGGGAREAFLGRLAEGFLERGGRLIVASYGTRGGLPAAEDVGALLRAWGFEVEGEAQGVDSWSGKTLTRVAWVVAPKAKA